jgi:hypothetical protein
MTVVVLSNLIPGAAYSFQLAARAEPWHQMGQVPPGFTRTADADALGRLTLDVADSQRGAECMAVPLNGIGPWPRFVPGAFTRMVPTLNALVPDSMQSGSGDHVLQVQGRGLSISNRLFFGSAGQEEPVRPLEQKIITTVIKTDLWAPSEQPVWVQNAGLKSNVLTFTFTAP